MYAQEWKGEKIWLHSWIGADVPNQCLYEVVSNCWDEPRYTSGDSCSIVSSSFCLLCMSSSVGLLAGWRGRKDPIPEGCFECCLSMLHACKWTARTMLCVLCRRSQHLGSYCEKKCEGEANPKLPDMSCFEKLSRSPLFWKHPTDKLCQVTFYLFLDTGQPCLH